MKLPHGTQAIVDIHKLRAYCLNPQHPRGRNKARVFAAVGIRAADAERLQEALLEAARQSEAQPGFADEYGQRYTVDFEMRQPDRIVRVRSSWIILTGESVPRLTSCYVL